MTPQRLERNVEVLAKLKKDPEGRTRSRRLTLVGGDEDRMKPVQSVQHRYPVFFVFGLLRCTYVRDLRPKP